MLKLRNIKVQTTSKVHSLRQCIKKMKQDFGSCMSNIIALLFKKMKRLLAQADNQHKPMQFAAAVI